MSFRSVSPVTQKVGQCLFLLAHFCTKESLAALSIITIEILAQLLAHDSFTTPLAQHTWTKNCAMNLFATPTLVKLPDTKEKNMLLHVLCPLPSLIVESFSYFAPADLTKFLSNQFSLFPQYPSPVSPPSHCHVWNNGYY